MEVMIFKTALPLFEEILDRICAFYSNFARNIHAIDELRIPHLTIFGSIECPNTAEYSIWGAYLSEFGDGDGEGETPAQIFWHIGVQKKWYKLSKLGGEVEVIWTKSKRTATFFS